MSVSFPLAGFAGAIEQLASPLDQLASRAVQSGETILLETNTNRDEALLVTSSRIIILKGPSKRASVSTAGRFFPFADVHDIAVRRGFFGGHLTVVTSSTINEPQPFDMSRCSFAVSFRDGKKLESVYSYVSSVCAAMTGVQAQQIANGALSPVNVPGVIALQGEVFYYGAHATLYAKHTFTTYQGGMQGVSFRVLPGVYYRIGGTRG